MTNHPFNLLNLRSRQSEIS